MDNSQCCWRLHKFPPDMRSEWLMVCAEARMFGDKGGPYVGLQKKIAMPGVEDWLRRPLDVVQNLYERHGSLDVSNFSQYFKDKIRTTETLAKIPLLNVVPVHELVHGSLVRLRCMVQDIFDPEYFLASYEVSNQKSQRTAMRSGLYKDVAECGPFEEIDVDSDKNKTLERHLLYCIPIPGETEWVKAAGCRQKRSCDNEAEARMDVADEASAEVDMEAQEGSSNGENSGTKRCRVQGAPGSAGSGNARAAAPLDLNFPLPGETGPVCLVKIYGGCDFKLNEMVEFIGILSVDPAMAQTDDERPEPLQPVDSVTAEEKQARNPPPSLVPRLHTLTWQRLTLNNPLVPALPGGPGFMEELPGMEEAERLRSSLRSLLEHACLGDALAAEYLLCHLVARGKHDRSKSMPMGRMCLNISHVPTPSPYCRLLHSLLEGLVTQCHLLPLTVETLNVSEMVPKKDYTANRLRSGLLQLPENIHLTVDETVLQEGLVTNKGLCNVKALENMITWQKVDYDFQYHRHEFEAIFNVLIVSHGSSVLPKDFQVRLQQKENPDNLEEYFQRLERGMSSQLLNELRKYLSLSRYTTYSMTDDMRQLVVDDFVNLRQDKGTFITEEDLFSMLTLLCCLTTSEGKTQPTPELWGKVKAMEIERKSRMAPRTSPENAVPVGQS